MQKLWRCGLAFALSLPLVSCVEVVMRQPLSDEATSVFDEQLCGSWKNVSGPAQREDWTMFIGRQSGTRATYKIVAVGLQKDQKTIEVDQSMVSAAYSRIGKNRYLSALVKDKQRSAYLVLKYDFPDNNTLRLCLLRPDPLAKAIASRKIHGRVGTKHEAEPLVWGDLRWAAVAPRPWQDSRIEDVELTDSPDTIFQFLEQHSRECFPPEDEKVLKRVP
jgi:hypothetical protein